MQLCIMNSQGTCLKLFNFPSEAEASPHQLIEADQPAVELADSISWLVLLSKSPVNNITTADSLRLIFHMSQKNSVQPCRCLVRRLPDFELWAYVECGAGKRPERALRNFRTSILFSCFPHVWESSESWKNASGSCSGPQAACLFDRHEQPSLCGCYFSVCLFARYNTHYPSYICGIVHLQNVNDELFL